MNEYQFAGGRWKGTIPPFEHIEAYNEIMKKYESRGESIPPVRNCVNPDCNSRKGGSGGNVVSPEFYVESGFYFCEKCDSCNGKALGYFDYQERNRFQYRKKSIFQRKYHYENIVKDISKKLSLSDDEEYLLLTKLKDINEDIINEINAQFKRKRMISIFYIVKKLLEEMGCKKNINRLVLNFRKKHFKTSESGGNAIFLEASEQEASEQGGFGGMQSPHGITF